VFFAQSTFVLPEILLALFTVLSLRFYLDKKFIYTIIWLTLALFTKESAIVIWGTLTLFRFVDIMKSRDNNILFKLKRMLIFLIPLFFIFIFFLIQKLSFGWFFFPEHISHLSIENFTNRLIGYTSYNYIYMGRNLLTFLGIAGLIILIFKKDSALKNAKKSLYVLTFFIVAYLLFSSLNFYSPRYLLSILPFVLLLFVFFIKQALCKYHFVWSIVIFIAVIGNNIYFTINNRSTDDHTLGYRDMINVQKKMVMYCEDIQIYDQQIYTHFLMANNLKNKDLKYLSGDNNFHKVTNNYTESVDYAIFTSVELDKNVYENVKENSTLLKKYAKKDCWIELYRIEKN